jgi:hypothetical protein
MQTPEGYVQFRPPLRSFVLAAMHFPKDAERRQLFIDAMIGEAFGMVIAAQTVGEVADRIPTVDAFQLGKYAERWPEVMADGLKLVRKVKGDKSEGTLPGEFAGTMILLPLLASCQGHRIGRNAVYKAWGGDKDGAKRALQILWKDYSPVAHFWATFLIIHGIPDEESGFYTFLCIAEYFRLWGIKYHPERADEAIQSGNTISVKPDNMTSMEFSLSSISIADSFLGQIGMPPPSVRLRLTSEGVFFASENEDFICLERL